MRLAIVFGALVGMGFKADAASYYKMAVSMATGTAGGGAYYWPPGLSYLLSAVLRLTGPSEAAAHVVAILISLGCVAATVGLACEVLKDVRAQRVAGWIAVFYPQFLMIAGQTYSHPLAQLCLTLTVLFSLRAARTCATWEFLLAGASLGMGVLVRPSVASVVVALGAAALVIIVRGPRRWQVLIKSVAGAACAAAVVLPTVYHNYVSGGGPVVSTNNERNFFLGNNPYTPDYKTSHLGQRSLDKLDPRAREYLLRFQTPDRKLTREQREVVMREAWAFIREKPGLFLYRTSNRIRAFWGLDYYMARGIQEQYGLGAKGLVMLVGAEGGGYILLMMAALAGLFVARDVFWPGAIPLLLAVVFASEIPYAIAFSGAIYHFPILALLVPLAAASAARVAARPGEGRRLLVNGRFLLAAACFAVIQIEHAYYMILSYP
ncbi:MAG: glycosyltransferase family 39 protein [Phycisphaerae bacterium]